MLNAAGRRLATKLWQLLEDAWQPDVGCCWKSAATTRLFAVAGSRLVARPFAVAGSLRRRPGFCSCWKLMQWSYDQTSMVPLSPSATKNSPYPAHRKFPQRHKRINSATRKGQQSNRVQLAGPGQTPTTERKNDSARQEREPRKLLRH